VAPKPRKLPLCQQICFFSLLFLPDGCPPTSRHPFFFSPFSLFGTVSLYLSGQDASCFENEEPKLPRAFFFFSPSIPKRRPLLSLFFPLTWESLATPSCTKGGCRPSLFLEPVRTVGLSLVFFFFPFSPPSLVRRGFFGTAGAGKF